MLSPLNIAASGIPMNSVYCRPLKRIVFTTDPNRIQQYPRLEIERTETNVQRLNIRFYIRHTFTITLIKNAIFKYNAKKNNLFLLLE